MAVYNSKGKMIKSDYYDEKNYFGVNLYQDESIIADNLEYNNVTPDWDVINDVLTDIENHIRRFINDRTGHVPVEDYHSDNVYYIGYWFEADDENMLSFFKEISEASSDKDAVGVNNVFYYVGNISDILPDNSLLSQLKEQYGETGEIVFDSCEIGFEIPEKFTDNAITNSRKTDEAGYEYDYELVNELCDKAIAEMDGDRDALFFSSSTFQNYDGFLLKGHYLDNIVADFGYTNPEEIWTALCTDLGAENLYAQTVAQDWKYGQLYVKWAGSPIANSRKSIKSSKKINSSHKPIESGFEQGDKDAAKELFLYAVNNGNLYRQRTTPAIENLRRKAQKGIYDKERAVQLWQYIADEAARMYDKEFGSGRGSMTMFNKATRNDTARQLANYYEEQVFYDLDVPVTSSATREEVEKELDRVLKKRKVKLADGVRDESVDYIMTFFDEPEYPPKNAQDAVSFWYNDTKDAFPEMFEKTGRIASARYVRYIRSRLHRI